MQVIIGKQKFNPRQIVMGHDPQAIKQMYCIRFFTILILSLSIGYRDRLADPCACKTLNVINAKELLHDALYKYNKSEPETPEKCTLIDNQQQNSR